MMSALVPLLAAKQKLYMWRLCNDIVVIQMSSHVAGVQLRNDVSLHIRRHRHLERVLHQHHIHICTHRVRAIKPPACTQHSLLQGLQRCVVVTSLMLPCSLTYVENRISLHQTS